MIQIDDSLSVSKINSSADESEKSEKRLSDWKMIPNLSLCRMKNKRPCIGITVLIVFSIVIIIFFFTTAKTDESCGVNMFKDNKGICQCVKFTRKSQDGN